MSEECCDFCGRPFDGVADWHYGKDGRLCCGCGCVDERVER